MTVCELLRELDTAPPDAIVKVSFRSDPGEATELDDVAVSEEDDEAGTVLLFA